MKQHKKMIIATVIVFLVVILAGMFGVVRSASSGNEILENVYIDSMYVGGMTKQEAERAIKNFVETAKEAEITLKAGDNTQSLTAEEAGITFDTEQAVEDAYNAGRSGNLISRFIEICKLKTSKDVITLPATITKKQAKKIITDCEDELIVKMKNASLTREDGEFKIVEEKSGQAIQYDESVKTIRREIASWDKKDITITLDVEEEEPEYKAEDLEEIKDVLGTYSTSYASSSSNRKKNVENGCEKIDGTIVYPGEELSVYEIVEPFTTDNGYYLAPSYASGEVVESYGGGICQVSTTLYNAVLRAELEVTERSNHSMTVHYVPLAADAAIAGTSKDFKFVNDQDTPIYIEGKAGGGTITFTIYGKETRDENRTIEFESKTISVKSPSRQETKDSTLEEGKEVVTQSGTTGYVAELWKVVYVDGEETERTKVNTSTYNSTPTKVRVGTKKKTEATTEATTESTTSAMTAATTAATTEATTKATTESTTSKKSSSTSSSKSSDE